MNADKQIITQEGYDKMVDEITERETVIREKIADDIEHAREQGDLSENSAYKAAMEAKEFNENQISILKENLAKSEVSKTSSKGKIGLGAKVTLENKTNGNKVEYQLVGNNEADPVERKISLESPIGKVIEGRDVGDIVKVTTPGGEVEFIIKNIS